MIPEIIFQIASLRLCIGFLGEQQQYCWWSSQFFSPISPAYLTPVFGRTSFLTQYYGVRDAAVRVHDEYIGIGKSVFHLFRLPETMERDLHGLIHDGKATVALLEITKSKEQAEQFLLESIGAEISEIEGPVRVGAISDLGKEKAWKDIAQYYLRAFQTNTKVFPFVSEKG